MTPSWNLSALFGPIARPLAGFNFNFKWKDSKGRKQGGYTLNVDADEEESQEMVQMYGATPSGEHGDANWDSRAGDGEGAALLGGDATAKKVKQEEGTATLASGVGNLANTIIGSGMFVFL